MTGFKNPNFVERQEVAAKAKQAALERFRAKAADPALAERLKARATSAADRTAIKNVRDAEKAEAKVRDAERAQQSERTAAIESERANAEGAERVLAFQAEQKTARDARYAARKSRSKHR